MNGREYVDDLKAIERALIDFIAKHGRPAIIDLEMVYAAEALTDEAMFTRLFEDEWDAVKYLASSGFTVSEATDDTWRHMVFDEVAEALTDAGLLKEV
jgi:hypothetical protein